MHEYNGKPAYSEADLYWIHTLEPFLDKCFFLFVCAAFVGVPMLLLRAFQRWVIRRYYEFVPWKKYGEKPGERITLVEMQPTLFKREAEQMELK